MDLLINLEGKRCQEAFHQARIGIQKWQANPNVCNSQLTIVSIDNQIEKNIEAYLASEHTNLVSVVIESVRLTDVIRQQLQVGWAEEYDQEDVTTALFGKVIVIKKDLRNESYKYRSVLGV